MMPKFKIVEIVKTACIYVIDAESQAQAEEKYFNADLPEGVFDKDWTESELDYIEEIKP